MVQVTVTHADGSTDTIDQTLGWSETKELGAMRRVSIDVERSAASNANLVEKEDDLNFAGIDPVRLVDINKRGSVWTLIGYSYEWLANTVAPIDGGNLREDTDNTMLTGLVNEVPAWSVGTINSFTGPLSFVFNHALRHEAIRRIERNVPGEIQFRDSGTVDYVSRIGTDKSGSITLSPAQGNIDGDLTITNRGRELDGTHIRVLGAHEGEAQIFATLVPSSDGNSYANRVDYTTSRWSSGDTRDWDRWTNKDVTDQATIEEEAAALADEITDPLVEAKATVVGEDIDVGDTVHVEKPAADLDRDMRIHRLKTVVEAGKEVYECLLSTRTTVRKGDSDTVEDIQRFNTGFQGSSVTIQGGGSRQPVNGSLNAEVPFKYPNIEYENAVELQVRGLPYRAYSSGAASGGGSTETTQGGGGITETTDVKEAPSGSDVQFDVSNSNDETLNDGEDYSYNGQLPSTYSGDFVWLNFDLSFFEFDGGFLNSPADIEVDIIVDNTWTPINRIVTTETGGLLELSVISPRADPGENIEARIENQSGRTLILAANSSFEANDPEHTHQIILPDHTHDINLPNHTHPPDPGISEFGSSTPSNVDVLVNGSTVATDIGSGTFQTTVDLSGELTQNNWNTIELTSDSLGHLQATVSLDGYKQIGASQ